MDVCVVTYGNTAERVAAAIRAKDRLYVRDNTFDNIGFAAAANAAASQGSDPLIAFVNPDGDPRPGCFDALERALDDPTVVAVEAMVSPEARVQADMARPLNHRGDPEFLFAACIAMRRGPFEAVGGFDGRLFMYYEDVDLSHRLSRYGKFRIAGDAAFAHDATPHPFLAHHRLFRNHLVVERRHRRVAHMALLVQLGRDAVGALRLGHRDLAAARITGALDYLVRGRRWIDRPLLLEGAQARRAGSGREMPHG